MFYLIYAMIRNDHYELKQFATIKTVSSVIMRFDGTDRLASADYSAH